MDFRIISLDIETANLDMEAEELRGKLPLSWRHPKGRNPDAHVAKCIKNKFRKD